MKWDNGFETFRRAIGKQILCKFNITYEAPIKYVIYWHFSCSISFALICAVFMDIPVLIFHFQVIKFLLYCFPHRVDFMFFSFLYFLHSNEKDKVLDRRPRNIIKCIIPTLNSWIPTAMNGFLLWFNLNERWKEQNDGICSST